MKSRKYAGPCVPGIEADNTHNIVVVNEVPFAYTPKLPFSGISAQKMTVELHKILHELRLSADRHFQYLNVRSNNYLHTQGF